MLPLFLILPATVVWCVLAFRGVELGRQGKAIIFRSWMDFAITAALFVPVLTLIIVLPWLWMTRRANRRRRDLWVVVPAKISLVVLAGACSVLAISCVITALSPKTKLRRRVVDGAAALGTAGIAIGLFRTIHQLVANASHASRAGAFG